MSFGSQTVGDDVVLKFDINVYTSVLTFDEVKNLVAEYTIPLDLHPNVSPSGLTMNRLPADKIGTIRFLKMVKELLLPVCLSFSSSRWPKVFMLVRGPLLRLMKSFLSVLPNLYLSMPRSQRNLTIRRLSSMRTRGFLRPKGRPKLPKTKLLEKGDDSTCIGSGTYHSALPINTIIPDDVDPAIGEGSLVLESIRREEDDPDRGLDNVKDGTETDSPPINHPFGSQHSDRSNKDTHVHSGGLHHDKGDEQAHRHASGHEVSSSSGGSARWAFPKRNPSGDGAGSSLRGDAVPPNLFSRLSDYQALQRLWFKLGHEALAQIDLLQWYEALNDDYKDLYKSHRSCGDEHLGCVGKEAGLVEKLVVVEKEKDNLLDKNREEEERIRRLEKELASKTSSLTKAESSVSTLKGDLECLTVDISHAEIAITARWSKGMKVECTQEDTEAILAGAADYDHHYKDTFMFAFDYLFTQSCPYVEKLAESFRLPLGDLQNMWPGERLAFRKMHVTWPLALGLIRSVLPSGKCTSLGHWRLDSSWV
uniref:Transposase (Putative), gypsy type n=1 Tax=Tanacetum cinerariifolium TaxID=118510 RepID=A0A6L2JW23_TANCI|nr:hypothetical protein [Tanacetum cinerariifolium]